MVIETLSEVAFIVVPVVELVVVVEFMVEVEVEVGVVVIVAVLVLVVVVVVELVLDIIFKTISESFLLIIMTGIAKPPPVGICSCGSSLAASAIVNGHVSTVCSTTNAVAPARSALCACKQKQYKSINNNILFNDIYK